MTTHNRDKSPELRQKVKSLLASQRLCVLSTDAQGQPYSSLVAFAETDDLRKLLFVTSRHTSKYSNVLSNKNVAVLVDSRSNTDSDFGTALAITAIGEAAEAPASDTNDFRRVFLSKHPDLRAFVDSPDSVLLILKVKLLIVAGFSETNLLYPDVE